ncbi:MAG: hypothetical protein KDJ97_35195 [Anaerolineae bacterium]|nr:hypothetical protein [Anaerolineae bacterium]
MKTIGTIFLILVTLTLSCYLCSQVSSVPIYDLPAAPADITLQSEPTPEAPAGITLQTQPIPAATLAERTAFWLSFWNGLIIVTTLVLVGFIVWGAVMLLGPLADGLDKLVSVVDHFRKVMFDSRIDVIQVKKSDRMSDIDVEAAQAQLNHSNRKTLLIQDRLRDVTDLEVVERAYKLKMSQKYGRLMLHAQREAMRKGVTK